MDSKGLNLPPSFVVSAVVPAAGSGNRFGGDKLMADLCGKPVLARTLEAIHSMTEIAEIVPVVKAGMEEEIWRLAEEYHFTKIKRVVQGGRERQDSVLKGLQALLCNPTIAVIHDGARPLISTTLIREAINALSSGEADGIVAAVPVKDTVKEVEKETGLLVHRTIDRSLLWAAQTPQVFSYSAIMSAFHRAYSEGFYSTDDSAVLEHYGGRVRLVMGSYENIKITTPEDLEAARLVISRQQGITKII